VPFRPLLRYRGYADTGGGVLAGGVGGPGISA
jgi:hypothetical protein